MDVVAYFRVSTDKQVEKWGIPAQQAAVEAFCEAAGHRVVSSHTDEGVSGKTGLEKRPGLLQAIAAARISGSKAIVVSKMDRVSRDVLLQLTLEKSLGELGIKILSSAGEGTEDDSPHSTLVRNLMAVVAQHEAAMVSVRTKAAMRAAKAKGVHVGRPPMGMIKSEWGGWEAGPDFWMVVRILCARFRKKMTYQAIADEMNGLGCGRTFSRTHVFNTCKRYGRRTDWYRPYRQLSQIHAGMSEPAWLDDWETAPRM